MSMRKLLLLPYVAVSLAGCSNLGPDVIRAERLKYNDAVHDTSAELLLTNIVRVADREAPAFSDVVGEDVTPNYGVAVGTGSTTIGGIPTMGILNPSFSASELSLQRNVNVTGGQLTQQISSPITLKNIKRLNLAAEPTVPLFRFSFIGIGPLSQYNRVINIINFLDYYGAIDIETRTDNTMNIGLRKDYLNTDQKGVARDDQLICIRDQNKDRRFSVLKMWKDLTEILGVQKNGQIVLRTSEAGMGKDKQNELQIAENQPRDTLVYTQTALGSLRQAVTDKHTFLFLSHEQAEIFRRATQNLPDDLACANDQFYLQGPDKANISVGINQTWRDLYRFPFDAKGQSTDKARKIGARTTLLIIETSAAPLASSYVSIRKNGIWYSIDNSDKITKQNFTLLNSILTIQAAPASNNPTQAAITVNGR